MFETVQIAKRHMLRLEYPEAAAALDGGASPAWVSGVADAVRAWFGGIRADDGFFGDGGDDEEETSSDEDDRETTPIAPWYLYYYY